MSSNFRVLLIPALFLLSGCKYMPGWVEAEDDEAAEPVKCPAAPTPAPAFGVEPPVADLFEGATLPISHYDYDCQVMAAVKGQWIVAYPPRKLRGKVSSAGQFETPVEHLAEDLKGTDALATGADGRRLFASTTSQTLLHLQALDADGIADPAFGAGGSVWVGFDEAGKLATATSVDAATGLSYGGLLTQAVLQADGKVLIAGHLVAPGPPRNERAIVARLARDGSVDATFGEGGKVDLDAVENTVGDDNSVKAGLEFTKPLVPLADGSLLVVAGRWRAEAENQIYFAKLDADGKLVESYGDKGYARTEKGVAYSGQPIVAKALTANHVFVMTSSQLRRFTRDGVLDSSFATNGILSFPQGDSISYDYPYLRPLPDGGIMLVGSGSAPAPALLYDVRRVVVDASGQVATDEAIVQPVFLGQAWNFKVSEVLDLPSGGFVVVVATNPSGGEVWPQSALGLTYYSNDGTRTTSVGTNGQLVLHGFPQSYVVKDTPTGATPPY